MRRNAVQIFLLSAFLVSCRSDQENSVFEQARSPDGAWLAQAIDERHFGPGNAAHFIRVTLKGTGRAVLNGGEQDILVLEPRESEGYQDHPAKHVSLRWQSPTKLVLRYNNATTDFVVARIAGVDVITQAA